MNEKKNAKKRKKIRAHHFESEISKKKKRETEKKKQIKEIVQTISCTHRHTNRKYIY